ncbi:MAG: Hydrogenase isoenzymes nickel incorporation protein HypB [candidate division BRC1 bacterium ADurb.BinA364]|nr:MAG: Hydrogenase isoenzymes nickel incorporation protein HypB [candidate division BRC1 bacterium ADurb.BinA364]
MFRTADALCVTKMDLLPYVSFSLERARQSLAALQPAARLLTLSAKTGEGVGEFLDWLRKELR